MVNLEYSHPDVHSTFVKGLFPVRRSYVVWSGVFTDLYIEQVLMTSIKSSASLTRGRGFSETTRLLFLLSRPVCAEVSQSIFDIAGFPTNTEDGHRDLKPSRILRDMDDARKLLTVLVEREPFHTSSDKLVSLSTGLVANEDVNVDEPNVSEMISLHPWSSFCV